jgi:hypothetical protein
MSSGFKWFYVRSLENYPSASQASTARVEDIVIKEVGPIPFQLVDAVEAEQLRSTTSVVLTSSMSDKVGTETAISRPAIAFDHLVDRPFIEVLRATDVPIPTRFVNHLLLEQLPVLPKPTDILGVQGNVIELLPARVIRDNVMRSDGVQGESFASPNSPALKVRADGTHIETFKSPVSPNLYVRSDVGGAETFKSPKSVNLYVRSDVGGAESVRSLPEYQKYVRADGVSSETIVHHIHDDDLWHVEQAEHEVIQVTPPDAYRHHVEGLLPEVDVISASVPHLLVIDQTKLETGISQDVDPILSNVDGASVEGFSVTHSFGATRQTDGALRIEVQTAEQIDAQHLVVDSSHIESFPSEEKVAVILTADGMTEEQLLSMGIIDLNRLVDRVIPPEIFFIQPVVPPLSGSYVYLNRLQTEVAFQENALATQPMVGEMVTEVSYQENPFYTIEKLGLLIVEVSFDTGYVPYINFFGRGISGDVIISANTNLGDGTVDGDYVVAEYENLTINSGVTLSTSVRKRGLIIYVRENCVISGSISMTARGGSGTLTGGFKMHKNTSGSLMNGTYATNSTLALEQTNQYTGSLTAYNIPQTGAAGGSGNVAGTAGTNGSGGGGGGGSGGNFGAGGRSGGSGAAGGCFGGGGGGGGAGRDSNGGNAVADSGQGGNGGGTGGFTFSGGGGAGNPGGSAVGGSGYRTGQGVGGVIYLIVGGNLTIRTGASIVANGVNGGNPYAGNGSAAGGSGGGSISLLYGGTLVNNGTVQANGGLGGITADAAPNGAPGGAGSIRIFKVLQNP